MLYRTLVALVFGLLLSVPPIHAQETDSTSAEPNNPYGTGAGMSILLTNSGFGLGGYTQWAFTPSTSLFVELTIVNGKDRREQKFFDFWGNSVVPNKANYFLMAPLRIGVHRRLFRNVIQENFRPFVQATVGPSVGWEWPYFNDSNGNGVWDQTSERKYGSLESLFKGESKYGFGGSVGIGVHWGRSQQVSQGVRISYSFNYFLQEVQLMEDGLRNARRHYFGTPAISLVFGRLW